MTRIFVLARPYQTLVRELVNQLLPTYVSTCLSQISSKSSALEDSREFKRVTEPILLSFNELLPHYPSLFRPALSKIRPLLLSIVGAFAAADPCHAAARDLLVLLHQSASKKETEATWIVNFNETVSAIHQTADRLFRPIIEDWQNPEPNRHQKPAQEYSQEVRGSFQEPIKLPDWKGVYEGAHRMQALMSLLKDSLTVPTAESMPIPIGSSVNVASRVLHLVVPIITRPLQSQLRVNTEVTKLEREELFAVLPSIHVAALQFLRTMVQSLGEGLLPVGQSLIDYVVRVFGAEQSTPSVRTESYKFLTNILPTLGPSLPKQQISSIKFLIQTCCKDLTEANFHTATLPRPNNANEKHQSLTNGTASADSFLRAPQDQKPPRSDYTSPLLQAAQDLLPVLLQYLPARHIPLALRADMDRTAILTQDKDALLASLLNPAPSRSSGSSAASVMPFFARACQGDLMAEGVLRPRMPVVASAQLDMEDLEDEGGEDVEMQIRDPWSIFKPGDNNSEHSRQNLLGEENRKNYDTIQNEVSKNPNTHFAEQTQSEQSIQNTSDLNKNNALEMTTSLENLKRTRSSNTTVAESFHIPDPSSQSETNPQKRVRLQESTAETAPLSSEIKTTTTKSRDTVLDPAAKGDTKTFTVSQAAVSADKGKGIATEELLQTDSIKGKVASQAFEDDSESDFEMPTIDLGMDTEDEEDEDVDLEEDNDDEGQELGEGSV
ncbi:MAG: hypothetical protein Q9227_006362 [Pyrenula ochraceoflavens]